MRGHRRDANGSSESRGCEHSMWIGLFTAQVRKLRRIHLGMRIMAPASATPCGLTRARDSSPKKKIGPRFSEALNAEGGMKSETKNKIRRRVAQSDTSRVEDLKSPTSLLNRT